MNISYSAKLRQRKKEIDRTLRHLEDERRQVEDNTEWVDRASYESRLKLLDELTRWYVEETAQIARALAGRHKQAYGLCFACHQPIESELLEICAQAELCFDCRQYEEILRSGSATRAA